MNLLIVANIFIQKHILFE